MCAVGCCDAQAEVRVEGARSSGSGHRVVFQTAALPETSRWVVRVRILLRLHIIQIHTRRCCLTRRFVQNRLSIAHGPTICITLFFSITEWAKARLPTGATSILRITNQPSRSRALHTPARARNAVRYRAITNGTQNQEDCGVALTYICVAEETRGCRTSVIPARARCIVSC